MKIYQDVVYNHSSRWGAKGLFTPKVYGVRDSQWSWYYDEKERAGFEYDGLTVERASRGQVVPTTATCGAPPSPPATPAANWGTPTGAHSHRGLHASTTASGRSPTSGMFPATLYHQCWIGNWEGEDSRSCWLHEDLADFNTENAAGAELPDRRLQQVHRHGRRRLPHRHRRAHPPGHLEPPLPARDAGARHPEVRRRQGAKNFYVFGEVAAFVNDKWNRGSVNHSAQFFTWKERKEYSADDVQAALEQYDYEKQLGTGQPADQHQRVPERATPTTRRTAASSPA